MPRLLTDFGRQRAVDDETSLELLKPCILETLKPCRINRANPPAAFVLAMGGQLGKAGLEPLLCWRLAGRSKLRLYDTKQNALRTGTGFRGETRKTRHAALQHEAARFGTSVGYSQRVRHRN